MDSPTCAMSVLFFGVGRRTPVLMDCVPRAGPALPEICASGFRNPWRCGFDRETDELYCGDVGHTFVEEIDIVE